MNDRPYGQVSNPDRYRVLHNAAVRTLARLEHDFDVRRSTGLGIDTHLANGATAVRIDRLVPSDPRSAPITVAFTGFPGIIVRFGRWGIVAFPACGCDACDEDPDELSEQLSDMLVAVAEGNYSERIFGGASPEVTVSFKLPNGSRGSSGILDADRNVTDLAQPPADGWRAWPARPAIA